MHPDGNPTLFIDLFLGAILCLAVGYVGWKYWKHKASEHWPMVAATFEGGEIQTHTSSHGGQYYSLVLNFAYQVTGQKYHGNYSKILAGYSETDANELLQSLKEGPLYVRYRPAKPKDYVCDPFRDVRP